MKKNIGPGVLIAAAAIVIGIVGFFAFKTFFTDPNDTPLKGAEGEKKYSEQRRGQAQRMQAGRDVPFNGGK